ncbi:MAG TPA: isoprenylcysteine carboxylmethyltransferase family protein [Acidobacteriota bacterium]|nr:isoprenylcysteine carboxylmethyltransferase family protein [Acidobacteriota bacterium]
MSGGTFFAIFMVFVIVERILETRASTKAVRGKKTESWSLPVLFMLHCLILASVIVEFALLKERLNLWVTALGLFLFGTALILRLWALRTLAEYWSLHVEIRPSQRLIKQGPYRLMRHPAYAAIILEFVAIPLVGNCYLSLGLVLALYFPVLALRIVIEEKALIEKFGQGYEQYRKTTGALLPFRPLAWFSSRDGR